MYDRYHYFCDGHIPITLRISESFGDHFFQLTDTEIGNKLKKMAAEMPSAMPTGPAQDLKQVGCSLCVLLNSALPTHNYRNFVLFEKFWRWEEKSLHRTRNKIWFFLAHIEIKIWPFLPHMAIKWWNVNFINDFDFFTSN